MVSNVGIKIACLENQSTMMRIMSKLEKNGSFSIKFVDIKFYSCSKIESCLWCWSLDCMQVT